MALIIFGTVVVVAYLFLLGKVITLGEDVEVSLAKILSIRQESREKDYKIDLILKHLDLEYVPEQYKTAPAKLEKRKKQGFTTYNADIFDYIARQVAIDYQDKPKKKRKYTKSGKYSKKK